jgi:hypothetical protein
MTSSEVVAYNVCKSYYYETVGTFLECSLCNAGWPMKTGRISVSFYTNPCRLATGTETYVNESSAYPSPSWFWGFESTEMQLGCAPVPEGQEYEANVWIGRAERGSWATESGASIVMEILGKLTQINQTSVEIDLQFNVLKNGYWLPYFSVTKTLNRKDTDLCLPCGRSYASDYIAVSPAGDVCHGDLRFIRISAGTSPWFEGCGPVVESQPGLVATGPVCGFFNGERLFTCFRAAIHSKQTPPAFPFTFNQLGVDNTTGNCSYRASEPYSPCKCLYGKKTGQNSVEADHYLNTLGYFNVGCPGESDTAYQKVQWASFPNTGFNILAKDTGDGSLCVVLENSAFSTFEVASSLSVISANSPYIVKAEFSVATAYLYAMKFPNPDLLPEFCYTGTGTTPNCGNEVFACNGNCTYTYSALFDNWVLTSGDCSSSLGYTCACVEPPEPASMVPPPNNGDTYETTCRGSQ